MVFPVVGGRDPSEGYDVSRSLRYYATDQYESFTPSSASNRRTWTWSGWIKNTQSSNGGAFNLFGAGADVSNRAHIDWNSDGSFQVEAKSGGSTQLKHEGGPKVSDPNAWYHVVWRLDTTDGTSGNRSRVYINGEQVVFSSLGATPSQNDDLAVNNNVIHVLGKRSYVDQNYFGGYLCEVHFTDGTSYAPTAFAKTDTNGVWVPIDCKDDLSYGTNGYYLEFKQTGTSQNSSGIGADTSGQDNHFATTNRNSTHVGQDTCTNNYMLMNKLYTNSRGTFTEAHTKVQTNVQGSEPYGQVEFGNFHVNSGKWYWEVKPNSVGSGGSLGLGMSERAYSGTYINGHNNGGSSGNVRYSHSNGEILMGASNVGTGATYTDNDIIMFAMDLDNSKFYTGKNGTWNNSQDPSNGTNGFTLAATSYGDYWTPWLSKDDTSNNCTVEFNFGFPGFSISSAQADDNGHGVFEYDVPDGFYAFNSKNLAQFG